MSLHSFSFFMGHASGPVLYGLGFVKLGSAVTLTIAAVIAMAIGFVCCAAVAGADGNDRDLVVWLRRRTENRFPVFLASFLAPRPIRRDALIRHPNALRQLAGLPEHVDRHAAARIEVAADAQPFRLEQLHEPLADRDRAVLVEAP